MAYRQDSADTENDNRSGKIGDRVNVKFEGISAGNSEYPSQAVSAGAADTENDKIGSNRRSARSADVREEQCKCYECVT